MNSDHNIRNVDLINSIRKIVKSKSEFTIFMNSSSFTVVKVITKLRKEIMFYPDVIKVLGHKGKIGYIVLDHVNYIELNQK